MSATLTAARRAADLDALAGGHEVDVLVVGGGVTGAGVALDAVTRGLSVALVERRDLANGTSRWSSKLAHGGLRYLAQGRVGIAWESARERALLVDHIAPHLVRALPILLPLTDDVGRRTGAAYGSGVRLGDGLRAAARTSRRRLPPARRISAEEARRWAPALRGDGLRGALLHWDGQLEDDARLVVALARTAAAHGARVLTYASALRLHADGAVVRDELTGARLDVRARHVVNATGVWASGLVGDVALRPSKGAHLLVPAGRLGDPRAAFNVPVPGGFGRVVFAVPRTDGLVMIGLTDEPFADPAIPDAPAVTAAEERFLLETVGRALAAPLGPEDVVGRFAGLRPLLSAPGDSTAELARDHLISEDPATGVVSVVGGKLTTYRRMAQDAVDRVAARPGVAAGPCRTPGLAVVGADGPAADARGLPPRLVRRYGAEAEAVAALARDRPELLRPVAPGVPVLGAELVWAVLHEGALTAGDVVHRRTRAGLVPEWADAVHAALRRLVPELDGVAA